MSFSIKTAVVEDGPVLRIQTPAAFWIKRGAVLALLVPALLVLLTGLFALLEVLQGEEPGVLTMVVGAGSGALSFLCVAVGGVHVVRAGPRSAASLVELDVEHGVLRSLAEGEHPLAAVRGLELRKTSPLLKWHEITATLHESPQEDGNPYRPPKAGKVRLIGNINEFELKGARELLADLAGRLGVESTDNSSVLLGGGGTKGKPAYGLAYIPVQGIFLLVSVGLLIFKRDDPAAQFHARQSLAFFPLELAALFLAAMLTAPFMFITDEPHPAAMALMALALMVVAIGRLVVRFVAAYRAFHGRAWVIPGMGWLTRR